MPMTNPSTQLPEEMIQRWRQKALNSTYFMGKAVIGFKDLDPDLHWTMAQWIDNGAKRKLGLAPRDHLKTSVWTISNCVKRIANWPEIRILIINEVATNAQHMHIRIRKGWENCEM